MLNKIKEISLDFIAEYVPTCQSAMITGSASSLEMNKFSDIDILILDGNVTRDYMERIYFQGFNIDCIIMPIFNISDILIDEINTNNNVYIDMLSKGIIIKDTFKTLTKLKDYAIEREKAGPKRENLYAKKAILFRTYNLYEDLLADRVWNETIFIAMDLFQCLISLNATFNDYWTSNRGKWRFRYLNQYDRKFTENITESFTKIISERNKLDFLQFAKETLSGFGPQPKQYSSRYYSFVVKNEMLSISIKSEAKTIYVYEYLLEGIKSRLKLYSSSIKLFYIRNDKSINDPSDYLIFIHGDDEILNFIVKPILLNFLAEKSDLLKKANILSSLNYYLEPQYLFANQDLYELAKPILLHFNLINENTNGLDENLILTYLTQFHLCLGSKLGFTIHSYINFNEYLLSMLMPYSIDKGSEKSFGTLEENKIIRLKEYEFIFSNQRKRMIRNYSNIYKKWTNSKCDYVDDYIYKGLLLIDSFYRKLDDDFFQNHPIPQFKLTHIAFEISDLEKKCWLSLSELLSRLYSSVLLSVDQKAYLVYSSIALFNSLSDE